MLKLEANCTCKKVLGFFSEGFEPDDITCICFFSKLNDQIISILDFFYVVVSLSLEQFSLIMLSKSTDTYLLQKMVSNTKRFSFLLPEEYKSLQATKWK